jgi:hypothetical protein
MRYELNIYIIYVNSAFEGSECFRRASRFITLKKTNESEGTVVCNTNLDYAQLMFPFSTLALSATAANGLQK